MLKRSSLQRKLTRDAKRRTENSINIIQSVIVSSDTSSCTVYEHNSSNSTQIVETGNSRRSQEELNFNCINSGKEFYVEPEQCGIASAKNLEQDLREWAVKNKISHSSLSALLRILKLQSTFENLPLDARTLLKTPRQVDILKLDPGLYCHFGLKRLNSIVPRNFSGNKLSLQFSVDGIPISKSSKQQFWPILCFIIELNKVIEVGIYCGNDKPKSFQDFLKCFVKELKEISAHGIEVHQRHLEVIIDCFICDAPARAYVLNIKGHTGYFGCGKCIQEGDYNEHRVTFPQTGCPLRTNESFRLKSDIYHHHGDSELENLEIDLIKQFPYEFMHLVCLGVVRKLLLLWISGSVKKFRLSGHQKLQLSQQLIALKSFVPVEFARKPRSLDEIKRWKATELRQFLLYTGPLVTKSVLPSDYYNHFVCLHLAIRILCNEKLHKTCNRYAASLLETFVKNFGKLYGDQHLSYNVHGLVHLADDCNNLGPLDKFSAFKFENHLGYLSSLLKCKNKPLEQVCNRISERNATSSPTDLDVDVSENFIVNKKQTEIVSNNYRIKTTSGNNICELKSGQVVQVKRFHVAEGSLTCGAILLENATPLFTVPDDSRIVGIRLLKLSEKETTFPVSSIYRKCVGLPVSGKLAIFPLIHQ